MTIHIALFGVSGRMGRTLLAAMRDATDFKLTGALASPSSKSLGRDAGEFGGGAPLGITITADRERALAGADAVIDFTLAASIPGTLHACASHGRPLVLGTTGLSPSTLAQLRECAAQIPILCSPNMSLGVNVMFALVKSAARALGADFDIDILDVHHQSKVDAPSGTALRLAESAAAGRGQDFATAAVIEPGPAAVRSRGQIVLSSIRKGEEVGEHRVTFTGPGESLRLTHRASDRTIYARGALHAARWLIGKSPGLYSMADIF
jgi:4-hydroxy-tetrahydrodipicolinate reductase